MPNEVHDRAIEAQPVCVFLANLLMLSLLGIIMVRNSVTLARVGLQLHDSERNAVLGVTAAAALFVLQRLTTRLAPVDADVFVEVAKKRRVSISVAMLSAAAFSEEVWVALSILTLRGTGRSVATAVAITSVVFAIAHYQHTFGAAFAIALKGSISALLFVGTGSLITTFFWHFVGNLGSLYNARRR